MAEARGRGLLRFTARAVPALALLAWSFSLGLPRNAAGAVEWSALLDAVALPLAATSLWIGAGLLLFGATLAAAALRFHLLMRAADLPSDLVSAGRLILVAMFFNTLLPGGMLGDAWRVWEGHGRLRRGPTVLGVVALERVLGLQALGMVALCGAPWVPADALKEGVLAALVATSAVCAFGPFVLLHPATASLVRRGIDRLPERLSRVRRLSLETGQGLVAIRAHRRRASAAVVLSLVCQALPVAAVVALAQPLTGDVAAPWFAVVVPFVTLMSMLPISLGGAGVRELLFIALFTRVGMPAEAALALGLLTGLVNLAWAGMGGAVFLGSGRKAER